MQTKPLPPLEILNEWLSYDAETGDLLWKRTTSGTRGKVAGGKPNKTGYVSINSRNLGGRYQAHRIAWALYHQELPDVTQVIDHINGVKHDNRITNLRLTSQTINCFNRRMRSDNTSGHTGVYWCNTWKRWFVWFYINGKRTYIGRYQSFDDAVVAREGALRQANI